MGSEIQTITYMIVGSEKSGTTSLFRMLADHPDLHAHKQREMTYFRTVEFSNGWQYALKKYYAGGATNKVLIAKDVLAMYSKEALQRIQAQNPDIRITVMLRNPVERAYSAYWYSRRRGREPLKSFEAALDAEKNRLKQDPIKWLPNAYSGNGIYIRYLQDIIDIFGKENIKIYFLEQLKRDSNSLCQEIFRTIGVDPAYVPSVTSWHNKSGMAKSERMARLINRLLKSKGFVKKLLLKSIPADRVVTIKHAVLHMNEKPFTPPSMMDETRNTLNQYFQYANSQLTSLTGNKIPSYWK